MRPLMVCLLLLLPCMQAAAAGPPPPEAAPIVPVLTLSIAPTILKVKSTSNESAVAHFEGNAAVDKPPVVRCVVTLTSSTDVGLVSQISPTTMVFTSSSSQAFTVDVSVPQGSPSMQCELLVYGRAVAAGLQSTAEVKAVIDVSGTPILNQTALNGTAVNTTKDAGRPVSTGVMQVGYIAVAVIIALPAAVVAWRYYRRRRAPLPEA
jgi:hypothetical protein